jgi:hypothetical protein
MKQVYVLSLLILLQSKLLKSQCSSAGAVNAGTITPSTSWQTVIRAAGTQYYYVVTVSTCTTYTFSFCQGGGTTGMTDTQITITDNSTGTTQVTWNDDHCSFLSELVWTPTSAGTFRVLINQYSCTNPTASATLAYIYAAANTSNINYALNGNASSNAPYDCTTLTSATNNQLGCAWDVNSTLDFATGFTYDFTVNLGSSNAGADGMTFTIQNDPRGLCACGVAGNQLGAGSISNSLIVEIDTYINIEDRDDFTGADFIGCAGALDLDHLDIWTGGTINPDLDGNCSAVAAGERPAIAWAVALKSGANYYDIENGLNHILRITWATGAPGTLTAKILDAAATTTYGTASYSFNPLTVFGTNTPYFGFTASTGGLNNQQSFCNPLILLPVEFAKFDVTKEQLAGEAGSNSAKIDWSTATEINNNYFSIEKSTDSKNWGAIGKQNSKAQNGNSTTELNYVFYDSNLESGTNYYRIKQIDKNGKYAYSTIKSINNTAVVTMPVVFPNPFENNFNLTVLSQPGSAINCRVYNNLGQMILEENEIQSIGGRFAKKINVTEGPGIYYMVLTANKERFTYKLICTQ